jgi:hypothetical protein
MHLSLLLISAIRESFPIPKYTEAPFPSPPFTLAGFRVNNIQDIQVGDLPPEAA